MQCDNRFSTPPSKVEDREQGRATLSLKCNPSHIHILRLGRINEQEQRLREDWHRNRGSPRMPSLPSLGRFYRTFQYKAVTLKFRVAGKMSENQEC